tara:strand:+ start:180 stop:527 length:348 start_codon:yes stop_codon:yes gene_type:complete
MSRIKEIRDKLIGTEDPDDLMVEILDSLQEGSKMPTVGKFYVFVYNPKTPNIRYDQNPLVGVTNLYEWGFRGINFHWNEHRQYTWGEVSGGLYEISNEELNDLDGIPFARFRINS